jgi:hypothetical protein
MRTIRPAPALVYLAILAATGACTESLGPGGQLAGTTISVVPRTSTIAAGEVITLTAQVFDEFGDPMVGVKYTWASSNEAVATVSVSGTVYGRGEGRAAITATAGGQTQSSSVQVVGRGRPPKSGSGPLL